MIVFCRKRKCPSLGLILIFFACHLIYKGYMGYITYIFDTGASEMGFKDLDELSNLPLEREMDFTIVQNLGIKPSFFLPPYRMAPTVLKELKNPIIRFGR